MNSTQKWALYALVFVGGAVLMVLEIAGGRLLAPFFGSDIFVWGSIIGVFMVALALGYYLGGRTADKVPFLAMLALVEVVAGLTLMLLPAVGSPLCNWISRSDLGVRSAPFVSALLLFTVPSVLLAIASPFAVRIAARAVEVVGNVAGSLYALSTAGSILGTLLAAFVLIPAAGTRGIIFWVGVVELAMALAVFAIAGGLRRRPGKVAAAAAVILAGLLGLLLYPVGPGVPLDLDQNPRYPSALIHFEESPYHLILVTEQDDHDLLSGRTRKRRVLRFNNRVESAVYVDDLDEDRRPKKYESAVSYTALLHMGMVFHPEAKHGLFVGLGGGIGPTEFHDHYGMEVDVVDIDPAVARVAQEYFFLRQSDKLRLHVADGRRFLERTEERYDMIVLDAYSSAGRIPFQLVTKQFFGLVRSRLKEDGVVVSNVISTISAPRNKVYLSIYRTLYAAGFKNVYVFPRFPLKVEEPFYRDKYKLKDNYRIQDLAMNVILVATQDEKRLEKSVVQARAALLTKRQDHPAVLPCFEEYASFLYQMKYARPEDVITKMEEGVIFTDNYAPTDLMFAGL